MSLNLELSREEFIEQYGIEDGTVILEPFDDFKYAIVGITFDREHIMYDYSKLIDVVKGESDMSDEDAMEYVEYNIVGLGFSSHEPIICFTEEF
jgi:hypothetical protein